MRLSSLSSNESMAYAQPNFHSYDDTLRRIEDMVEQKYRSHIVELSEKNRQMERMGMSSQHYNPNSLVYQTQAGSITAIDLFATAGTTGVVCGSAPTSIQSTKKRDIKSLIAYYYKR